MADLAPRLAELRAEGDALDALVAGCPEARWATPTPAAGWTVATQIAHLAWTDEAARLAASDADAFGRLLAAALPRADTAVDDAAHEWAARPVPDLLAGWRAGRRALLDALGAVPEGARLPWFGPPMAAASMATARLMETWAHGQDVADALGVTREPTERLRSVAHLGVRTRDFAFGRHGRPAPGTEFRVELTAPDDSTWAWGPQAAEQRVSGPAVDFCLLVTRRRHRDDTALRAVGPDADAWLDVAQAFAGPPGAGPTARGR